MKIATLVLAIGFAAGVTGCSPKVGDAAVSSSTTATGTGSAGNSSSQENKPQFSNVNPKFNVKKEAPQPAVKQ
ncbi:MAG: hypothetical protein EOP51_07565 [Sphingobacteriales bacterium]|nr:MAG: hypothetical protein EOP51_07565 [Sphingobacteriales bacterium]